MVATVNFPMLSTVHGILRWMFRFHDTEGTGECVFEDLEHILTSVFQFYFQ